MSMQICTPHVQTECGLQASLIVIRKNARKHGKTYRLFSNSNSLCIITLNHMMYSSCHYYLVMNPVGIV